MTRNVLKSNTEPMRAGASGGFFALWPSAADILDRNGGEGPGVSAQIGIQLTS